MSLRQGFGGKTPNVPHWNRKKQEPAVAPAAGRRNRFYISRFRAALKTQHAQKRRFFSHPRHPPAQKNHILEEAPSSRQKADRPPEQPFQRALLHPPSNKPLRRGLLPSHPHAQKRRSPGGKRRRILMHFSNRNSHVLAPSGFASRFWLVSIRKPYQSSSLVKLYVCPYVSTYTMRMTCSLIGLSLLPVGVEAIRSTVSMPPSTRPKPAYSPSR